MKEVFDSIIDTLEDLPRFYSEDYGSLISVDYVFGTIKAFAEEYNGGWISVEDRLPEDCTIYEVTARFGSGMCYTEFAYYDESKGEWWKHDDDGLVNVLAWKEHSAHYQPKGE